MIKFSIVFWNTHVCDISCLPAWFLRLMAEQEAAPDRWFRWRVEDYWKENIEAASRFVGAKPENFTFVTNATTGNTRDSICFHRDVLQSGSSAHLPTEACLRCYKNDKKTSKCIVRACAFVCVCVCAFHCRLQSLSYYDNGL